MSRVSDFRENANNLIANAKKTIVQKIIHQVTSEISKVDKHVTIWQNRNYLLYIRCKQLTFSRFSEIQNFLFAFLLFLL